jgi:hypothetical protein
MILKYIWSIALMSERKRRERVALFLSNQLGRLAKQAKLVPSLHCSSERIQNFLEGKSTNTNHNVIVPRDHAITLLNISRYHKPYIEFLS